MTLDPTPPDGAAGEGRPGHEIHALAADLMFASRIHATAQAVGVDVALCRSADELIDGARRNQPRRVLLDLDARAVDCIELIRRLKADPVTRAIEVVAFVAHVREDAIRAARDAGADRVLARSAFVRELPSLLCE